MAQRPFGPRAPSPHSCHQRSARGRARSRLRLTIIFRDLALAHDEIIEAISWMCGVTAEWTLRQSRPPQSKR